MRDDAIALWEAYRRERSIMVCMERARFDYAVDLRASDADFANAAVYLQLESDPRSAPDGEAENDSTKRDLKSGELNRYYVELFGVTWDDISAEKGDITKSGCFADALRSIGNVWAAKDRLGAERLELNREAGKTRAVEDAENVYATCAADLGVKGRDQGEVEASGAEPATVDKVVDACGPAYDAVKAAELAKLEETFLVEHPELTQHAALYDDFARQAASDAGFLRAIGVQ